MRTIIQNLDDLVIRKKQITATNKNPTFQINDQLMWACTQETRSNSYFHEPCDRIITHINFYSVVQVPDSPEPRLCIASLDILPPSFSSLINKLYNSYTDFVVSKSEGNETIQGCTVHIINEGEEKSVIFPLHDDSTVFSCKSPEELFDWVMDKCSDALRTPLRCIGIDELYLQPNGVEILTFLKSNFGLFSPTQINVPVVDVDNLPDLESQIPDPEFFDINYVAIMFDNGELDEEMFDAVVTADNDTIVEKAKLNNVSGFLILKEKKSFLHNTYHTVYAYVEELPQPAFDWTDFMSSTTQKQRIYQCALNANSVSAHTQAVRIISKECELMESGLFIPESEFTVESWILADITLEHITQSSIFKGQ